MEEKILVKLGKTSYPIYIGSANLASLPAKLKPLAQTKKVRVITNPTVWKLQGEMLKQSLKDEGFQVDLFEVPDGEEYKSLEVASQLYQGLTEVGALRGEPIIAFGGGVIGDLAGFVAATYMRGVPYIQVPTTLLAQVDSSVGGKVAVNLEAGKNLVGAFYQPRMVLIDVDTLKTLPAGELKEGLVEVIKSAFLKGETFLSYLEKNLLSILKLEIEHLLNIIKESCSFKAGIVEEDERDLSGRRAILNYGHTVGHAIETLTGYREYRHGEAVAVGLVCAALIARKLGLIDDSLLERHVYILREASFSVTLPSNISAKQVLDAIMLDKKRKAEEATFVLLKKLGEPILREVRPKVIEQALQEVSSHG